MFFSFQNLTNLIIIILSIVCLLIIIAFYTVAERKIMASIQRRQGPHKVGFLGLLQAFADALKLLAKELLIPLKTGKVIFICAPWIILALSLLNWSVIPLKHNNFVANINYSINFILAISSLNVYCIIMAGWSSNSKYSFFGAIRSVSQMLSYEVVISVLILSILLISNSLNFIWINILQYKTIIFVFPLILIFIIFLIIILAETNRTPFDLPEAEAELVAGYNLEYSSIIFALFFLAEYANMLLMSVITLLFFFGYNFNISDLFPFSFNYCWTPLNISQKISDLFSSYFFIEYTFRINLHMFLCNIRTWLDNFKEALLTYLLTNIYINYILFLIFEKVNSMNDAIKDMCYENYFDISNFSPDYNNLPNNKLFYPNWPAIIILFICGVPIYLIICFSSCLYDIWCEIIENNLIRLEVLSVHNILNEKTHNIFLLDQLYELYKSVFLLSYFPSYLFSFILILLCSIYFILIRATLPRYRYDHLLMITWKCVMPLAFGILLILIKLLM